MDVGFRWRTLGGLAFLLIILQILTHGIGGTTGYIFKIKETLCNKAVPNDGIFDFSKDLFPDDKLYSGFSSTENPPVPGGGGCTVRLYGIKIEDDDGKWVPLVGWVHVVLDLTNDNCGGNKGIIGLIMQVDDLIGGYPGVGEFVYDFPYAACDDVNSDMNANKFRMPSRNQFIPCTGLAGGYPLLGNGFFHHSKKPADAVPTKNGGIFHLFWRINGDYCGQPKVVNFRVNFATGQPGKGYTSYPKLLYFRDDTIIRPYPIEGTNNPTLKCTESFQDLDREFSSWVIVEEPDITDRRPPPRWSTEDNCQHKKFSRRGSIRCGDGYQTCNARENINGAMEYLDYLNKRVIGQGAECKCPPLPRLAEMEPELNSAKSKSEVIAKTATTEDPVKDLPPEFFSEEESDRLRGVRVDLYPGSIIWSYRKIHAVTGLISTIFVTPVSIFVTRYYKETFLAYNIMFNKVWYMVHMISILINLQLYMCGMYAIYLSQAYLGHSRTELANTHGIIGWFVIALYLAMVLFGGFRPMDKVLRKMIIGLHWFCGIAHYGLSLFLTIQSIYLHGSPTATVDVSIAALESTESGIQFFLWLISLWILVDVGLHGAMIVHSCYLDALVELHRLYLPPPIPIVDPHNTEDTKGRKHDIRLLVSYASVSFLITLLLCVWSVNISASKRGFGFMECSHDDYNNLTLVHNC